MVRKQVEMKNDSYFTRQKQMHMFVLEALGNNF